MKEHQLIKAAFDRAIKPLKDSFKVHEQLDGENSAHSVVYITYKIRTQRFLEVKNELLKLGLIQLIDAEHGIIRHEIPDCEVELEFAPDYVSAEMKVVLDFDSESRADFIGKTCLESMCSAKDAILLAKSRI